MHEVGLATSTGLPIVAEMWRPVSMVDTFSWSMLQRLNRATCEAIVTAGRAPDVATKVVDFVIRTYGGDSMAQNALGRGGVALLGPFLQLGPTGQRMPPPCTDFLACSTDGRYTSTRAALTCY